MPSSINPTLRIHRIIRYTSIFTSQIILTLNIIVKNTYEELNEGKTLNKNPHGVGLSNLKRRLEPGVIIVMF